MPRGLCDSCKREAPTAQIPLRNEGGYANAHLCETCLDEALDEVRPGKRTIDPYWTTSAILDRLEGKD